MRYQIALLLTLMITPNNITPITRNSETLFPKSLQESLDLYGFTSPEQKEALAQLFNYASIHQEFSLSGENKTAEHSEQIRPEKVITDILSMVKSTQDKFTIRKGTQERWEICPRSWMVQNQAKILSCLTTLGFVKSIQPQKKKVDAICILGGTAEFMLGGVLYTEQLLKQALKNEKLCPSGELQKPVFESGQSPQADLQAQAIILLSGERYLTKNIDGTEQELEKLAQQLKLSDWRQLTEMHLLEHLFNTHANLAKKLTLHTINTPAGVLPRPTTQTTLLELFAWLEKHPEIKNMLFISHQPCTLYQKAVIDSMFFAHQIPCEYDVVGDARESATVQLTVAELGGYLWAATPNILTRMVAGLESSALESLEQNQELKKLCCDLYAHNQLLYQALPPILL